jgi:HPt (histidine-containing phosphotransfer) domain-containing protein
MNESREQRLAAARTRMAELAAKFIERTRGDLRTMRGDLEKARAGDAAALAQIRHLAHRMAGTGATLGFEKLGERAAGTEALIEALPDRGSPDARMVARLAVEIGALESQLATDAERITGRGV